MLAFSLFRAPGKTGKPKNSLQLYLLVYLNMEKGAT